MVHSIEQELEKRGDLCYRGLLSDKVIFRSGQWIPVASANSSKKEDTMQLHSRKKDNRLRSTAAVDESTRWCRDRTAVENGLPVRKSPNPCPPHPVENHGEHM